MKRTNRRTARRVAQGWATRSMDASPVWPPISSSRPRSWAPVAWRGRAKPPVYDLNPTFTIARYRAPLQRQSQLLAGLTRILDALPKAGAPDG